MKKNFLRDNRVFIIAEAGVNHNGKIALAKRLVDAARKAGCDAVKFQTFKSEDLVSRMAGLAAYQKQNNPRGRVRNQHDLIKGLELSPADFQQLKAYCDQRGIMFLSTPFERASADLLEQLKVPIYKISSGDLTNLPFLKYVAQKRKWIILSTGMGTLLEVREAVKAIYQTGNRNLVLLHCVTQYPLPFQEVNLRAIQTLSRNFQVPVGYSDHTPGIEIAIAAAAMGAKVIEKHLTIDRSWSGPDHKASLEPHEFSCMVQCIRHVEAALGDGCKRPQRGEVKNIPVVRKSLIAARDFKEGERISLRDIVIKRPGDGISPQKLSQVIGCRVKKPIKQDELIRWEYIA